MAFEKPSGVEDAEEVWHAGEEAPHGSPKRKSYLLEERRALMELMDHMNDPEYEVTAPGGQTKSKVKNHSVDPRSLEIQIKGIDEELENIDRQNH